MATDDHVTIEGDDEALLVLLADPNPDLSVLTSRELERVEWVIHADALTEFGAGRRLFARKELADILKIKSPDLRHLSTDQFLACVLDTYPECDAWLRPEDRTGRF